jgi:DNA-binding SARP family transcriptional activator/class 3 adenylate cyclase
MIEPALCPKFTLSLLGRFVLTGPNGIVELRSKKLAGLLAYLACTAPRPQSREKLSALLWGSHFDAQAKQNLRQALFRLRKVLGEDALASDGEVVSLNVPAVLCDVSRFETLVRVGSRGALSAAADLYRGRLIDDVTVSEEGWNEWLTGERERLLDLALGAMMGLGEQELAAGRAGHALKAGQRAIALNNMREDAHRLIVQALAATGRKAEALKHYQELVALLKHELNTQPDAATRSLAAELRATEPPSRSPPVKIAGPALPQPDRPSIVALPAVDMRRDHKEQSTENPAVDGEAAVSAVTVRSGSPERRQLTIMVCNIVGSMPLSVRLDPEDMHDLIAVFHKAVAGAVSRFDGFVAQYLGDGAHVYFGYPAAREHDAEQAVRAGFAILDAVGALKASFDVTLQASVGIATGLVVVGERPATGDAQQRVAIGEAPNVAVQLQALALPGEVVIAASTWRLVGRMFDCRALEMDKSLQAVEAWQVRGETAGVSRFEARRTGALSPLMGRQEEIELLLRRWGQAKLGEGRVVLLSGEPGIGKSRIAESLLAAREGEPHARLRYFCSPHHTHSPLYPFIAQLERAAGFEPGSSATAKLDRLEALLKPAAKNVPRDLALIADLLSVPADGRYPALAVSPGQKREMTLTAILNQLDGAVAHSPVLIVIEDIHWIDPTSLDLLDRLVAAVATMPVLLVVTFRPEFQPTWVGQPHVTMLPLSRLGRRDSAGIIGSITKDKALPNAVVEQILAHTDGVPLFIEELTSSLLESGLLRETTDSYMLDGPLPPLAIPTSLQASLVARLDRLASVKDVAQIGAAIGREFSHELISAVSASAPADLDAALERLMASGLVSRRGMPPEATYSFKHALVQDAAYGTLLKSRRRQLHAGIAKVLVGRFPAMVQRLPEVVAHHFTEAGLVSEAVDNWAKAGRLSHARWANREAVKFFQKALHILKALPQSRETLERAIDLRIDLKASLAPLGEFDRIFACLREAEELAKALGDQRRLGRVFVSMCHNLYQTGQPREALGFGRNAHAIAESLGDVPLQVTANLYFGVACLVMGDYRQAEQLLRQVLRLLERDLSRNLLGLEFPDVLARGYLTWGFADQGTFKEGIVLGQEAVRLAEKLDNPYSLAGASWSLAYLQISQGELREPIGRLERGLALTHKWHLTFLSTASSGTLGYAYALSGRVAEGISLLEHAVRVSATMGYGTHQPRFLADLGEAYVLAGRLDDALEVSARTLTLARERGRRSDEARALRLLAEVTARRNPPELADGHYREALALADELGMRPLAAHCHLGLGKLSQSTGALEQAQAHLAAATTLYRDMGMTYWLRLTEAAMCEPQ